MSADKVILLVEDNPMDEELTLRALKKSTVRNPIVVARDGVEALDYLFCRGAHAKRPLTDQPRLILLDLKLPKIDGIEVLEQLRSHPLTKLVPVVVLTSSLEDQDLTRCYSLGANSYVRKPVDFSEFTEAVKQLGVYWLALNETPPQPQPE